MKAFTDIEQSKKLAEILPLESADMCLTFVNNIWNPVWGKADDIYKLQKDCYEPDYTKDEYVDFDEFEPNVVPCWSLAALLSVLPNEIITDNRFECHYQIDIRKYDGGDNTTLHQIAYGNNRGLSGSWHDMINTGEKENLIDCCVQMILILHEQKLL